MSRILRDLLLSEVSMFLVFCDSDSQFLRDLERELSTSFAGNGVQEGGLAGNGIVRTPTDVSSELSTTKRLKSGRTGGKNNDGLNAVDDVNNDLNRHVNQQVEKLTANGARKRTESDDGAGAGAIDGIGSSAETAATASSLILSSSPTSSSQADIIALCPASWSELLAEIATIKRRTRSECIQKTEFCQSEPSHSADAAQTLRSSTGAVTSEPCPLWVYAGNTAGVASGNLQRFIETKLAPEGFREIRDCMEIRDRLERSQEMALGTGELGNSNDLRSSGRFLSGSLGIRGAVGAAKLITNSKSHADGNTNTHSNSNCDRNSNANDTATGNANPTSGNFYDSHIGGSITVSSAVGRAMEGGAASEGRRARGKPKPKSKTEEGGEKRQGNTAEANTTAWSTGKVVTCKVVLDRNAVDDAGSGCSGGGYDDDGYGNDGNGHKNNTNIDINRSPAVRRHPSTKSISAHLFADDEGSEDESETNMDRRNVLNAGSVRNVVNDSIFRGAAESNTESAFTTFRTEDLAHDLRASEFEINTHTDVLRHPHVHSKRNLDVEGADVEIDEIRRGNSSSSSSSSTSNINMDNSYCRSYMYNCKRDHPDNCRSDGGCRSQMPTSKLTPCHLGPRVRSSPTIVSTA